MLIVYNKTRTSSCQRVTVKVSVAQCWEIVAKHQARAGDQAGALVTLTAVYRAGGCTPSQYRLWRITDSHGGGGPFSKHQVAAAPQIGV